MPTLILSAIVAALLSGAGGFWYGTTVGRDGEIARREAEQTVTRTVRAEAMQGAADAIAANKPRNVTIKQEVQREIETQVVYRDCRHSPDQLRRINAAITGETMPAGDGQLPAASAPVR